MSAPYVVTLALTQTAQAAFDVERTRWFPPGRTQVGAHVTLFHAVPGGHPVEEDLVAACAREAFSVTVTGPVSLGRGVALRLESAELGDLHGRLQRRWRDVLTAQDRQGFRPHVTVQNKVTPEVARATLEVLASGFTAYDVTAVGLDLWRYLDGPWGHVRRFAFPH